jgi:hypothetical protein
MKTGRPSGSLTINTPRRLPINGAASAGRIAQIKQTLPFWAAFRKRDLACATSLSLAMAANFRQSLVFAKSLEKAFQVWQVSAWS